MIRQTPGVIGKEWGVMEANEFRMGAMPQDTPIIHGRGQTGRVIALAKGERARLSEGGRASRGMLSVFVFRGMRCIRFVIPFRLAREKEQGMA